MAKLTLSDLTSLTNEQSAIATINANHAAIETAMENTLSRDGTTPNTMSADLDMNSNNILNLPTPVTDAEPVTLGYLTTFLDENGAVAGAAGADGTNGTDGATIYVQTTAPATSGPASSLWIDSDSTDLDVYQLVAAAWVDTTMNLKGAAGAMGGPASSIDSEIALFDGITGTVLKRASTTGILKATAGVIAAAVAGTDYAAPGANTDITSVYLNNTGLKVKDTNASHGLTIAPGSDLTADRTLTVTTGDAARTVTISGDATISQDYSTTGNPQFATIELGAATDTTLSRAAAGILAVEGTQVVMAGKHTIWIPATAMIARTTNGAAAGSSELTTNKEMFKTLDFDTTTQEFAQFCVHMPKSWNESTVTFQPVWSHAATATNFGVVWALQAIAFSDDDAGDTAFGTEQTSTDTGGTTNDIYIAPESAAITIAGTPAENDIVYFQIKRNVSDGSDTLAVDARLHGVKVFYTTNAATDV